jgi:hypothetical protein
LLGTFLFTWALRFFLWSIAFLIECCAFWMKLINHELNNHIFFEEIKWCTLVYCALHSLLLLSTLYDSLLNCPFCDKLINIYISTLTNSMSSIRSLSIHCRVPIVIIEDDCIGSS